jgi:hypothetical protein
VPPGEFTIEINGSRRKIKVENGVQNEVFAGTFRISMPPAFSPEARAEAGGQPVFAYIDEGVLFNLNTVYPDLPLLTFEPSPVHIKDFPEQEPVLSITASYIKDTQRVKSNNEFQYLGNSHGIT